MKNKLLLCVFSLFPFVANAFTGNAEIDGINYYIITKGQTAEVVSKDPKYAGDIVIPSTIEYEGVVCNVTSIGQRAFFYCQELKSISIPNSVTSIGSQAFYGCECLTSLIIPESVTKIGELAFYQCTGLTSLTLHAGLKEYAGAFKECTGLTSLTLSDGLLVIDRNAFESCTGLTSLTIPSSVISIGKYAFDGCSSLVSVDIPNSVTLMEEHAFSYCSALKSVTISEGLTAIYDGAFLSCTSLTSVVIPNSVTAIGYMSFKNCSSLKKVFIGSNCNKIKMLAFANCSELTDMYCLAEEVPKTEASVFQNSYTEYATLHVPENSIGLYQTQKPWSDFKQIVALTDAETGVDVVKTRNSEVIGYYSLDGKLLDAPRKGINIVKMADGKTKKVVVK